MATERQANSFVWNSTTPFKFPLQQTQTRVYLPIRRELATRQSLTRRNFSRKKYEAIAGIQQFPDAGEYDAQHPYFDEQAISSSGGDRVLSGRPTIWTDASDRIQWQCLTDTDFSQSLDQLARSHYSYLKYREMSLN
ncbi:hypothetical protein Ocin01_00183 [Orchesella cincta]|uniref:Uncharacterized protein n=1 Tax=Orchesella cincta TaxID=48709 RepID=A0A1D2NMJ3_ORCCI|nr:hypothetical protein Ocin01_00183 [Orchesella cincta]